MIHRIIRASATTILLLVWPSFAAAYSTSSQIVVSRSFSAETALPGDTVDVVITADFAAIGSDPVRGFFLSDHIPVALSPSAGVITLDGNQVAAELETGPEDTMYSGCSSARWVMERPPAWSEARAIFASSTLVLTYRVTVPSDAENGAFTFPGFTWVGMIDGQGSAGDHFGYEDSAAVITVQGGVEPDDPDPDDPDPDPDPGGGGNGASEYHNLTGGCAAGNGTPGPVVLLLALAALGCRRRRRCHSNQSTWS